MLNLFTKHGGMHLHIKAEGDVEIDYHHTVEDIGIVLGKALSSALGPKTHIVRYGWAVVPMDEALCMVAIDLSSRPCLVYNVPSTCAHTKIGNLDSELIEEFFQAFANNAQLTLHINVLYGINTHHIFESVFKAFGIALGQAISIDPSSNGVKSTKGML